MYIYVGHRLVLHIKQHKKNYETINELFEDKDYLLHTTSIVPYPVFINNKNYTGFNPRIMDNEVLYKYKKKYFYKEVEHLSNTLIIPLGKAVEEILQQMIKENLIKIDFSNNKK